MKSAMKKIRRSTKPPRATCVFLCTTKRSVFKTKKKSNAQEALLRLSWYHAATTTAAVVVANAHARHTHTHTHTSKEKV